MSEINKNLEILRKHFSHCFDKNGNFDFEKFKKELSKNEVDFSKESYGLDWLWKSYARLLASDEATTFLKEDEDFNQKENNKNSQNLLIKWDNLEVLKHLKNAYYEKVKMIYIDPPYNTWSDGFVYQDDRKFTVEEFSKLAWVDEEKAKRILDFVDSKSNSHSAWLTFMYPRLYIAKQLLKDDGVIFVSIDDNEVAQLRLLMDEIFGEENFEGLINWRRRHNQPNDKTKMIAKVSEHILVFSKNSNILKRNNTFYTLPLSEERKRAYKNDDNDPRGAWDTTPWKTSTNQGGSKYKIVTPTGKEYYEEWMGSEELFKKLLLYNKIVFSNNGAGLPRKKVFWNDRLKNGQPAHNFWIHNEFGSNQDGSSELDKLLGKGIFDKPKPTKLLKIIIKLASNNNDLILDFFAGSWTTGDAVMQMNAEDGGNRKYILVQLPEEIDKKKNKTAYDFVKEELGVEKPTIFEITKERLIRAGKKIQEDNEKLKNEEKKDLSNMDFWFKIFETTPIWENYKLNSKEFNEQIKLFDESWLDETKLKTLLTTWKTYDGIKLTQNLEKIDLDAYSWYYFDTKLYLINKWFTTNNLKKLLEEIDKNPKFNPATIIAFGYNFESKVLREIAENIKSYANKKQIDIDFITRY